MHLFLLSRLRTERLDRQWAKKRNSHRSRWFPASYFEWTCWAPSVCFPINWERHHLRPPYQDWRSSRVARQRGNPPTTARSFPGCVHLQVEAHSNVRWCASLEWLNSTALINVCLQLRWNTSAPFSIPSDAFLVILGICDDLNTTSLLSPPLCDVFFHYCSKSTFLLFCPRIIQRLKTPNAVTHWLTVVSFKKFNIR